MDPKTFAKMISDIRILEKAMGSGIKKVEKSEKETRIFQRRGIWTLREIQMGEKFSEENIGSLRPVLGIDASKFKKVLTRKAKKKFRPFEPIKETDL